MASGGTRSELAFWIGGANSVSPSGPSGFRSLLAFWIGGATAKTQSTQLQILGGVVRGEIAWGGVSDEDLKRLREYYERRDQRFRREAEKELNAAVRETVNQVLGRFEGQPGRPAEVVIEALRDAFEPWDGPQFPISRIYEKVVDEIRDAWDEEEFELEFLLLGDIRERDDTPADDDDEADIETLLLS